MAGAPTSSAANQNRLKHRWHIVLTSLFQAYWCLSLCRITWFGLDRCRVFLCILTVGCFHVLLFCALMCKLCMDLMSDRSVISDGIAPCRADYRSANMLPKKDGHLLPTLPHHDLLPMRALSEILTVLPDHTPLINHKNYMMRNTLHYSVVWQ